MFLVQAIFLILIPVLSVVAPGSVSFWTNLCTPPRYCYNNAIPAAPHTAPLSPLLVRSDVPDDWHLNCHSADQLVWL